MKENRKLLQEVLNEIRQDMTDEEVLNLLADSKISVSPKKEKGKYTLGQRAAGRLYFRLQVCWFCGWSSTQFLRQKRLTHIRLFF